jgi:hypothetical protein
MTFSEFSQSLSESKPPESVNTYLQSLWYDGKGDWEKAHSIVQDLSDTTAAWVHAYLHRKEGDIGNADYWYRRAGRKRPEVSLAEEWEAMVGELVSFES